MPKEEIRKLTRVGKRSICVVVPADMVSELGWRERQKVTLERKGDTVVIQDFKKKGK